MSRTKVRRGLYGSSRSPALQREAFLGGEVPVAVYGLGKMGLPLASVYAETCGNVIGVDIDEAVVDEINRGECPVVGEPDLPGLVSDLVERDALRATTDGDAAADEASIHVVIVPTLIAEDGTPDLSALVEVVSTVAAGLDPGDLVAIESTVPPRTRRGLVQPLLEWESDLAPDQFGLACCPERTKSGRALEDVRGAHPKIVGGIDDESTRVAELVYGELTDNDLVTVSDTTVAEAAKVFEGVYRDVNIALANELGTFAHEAGFDVVEAIETANTQPFCDIHRPGPGVGGHCIPYYPYFLTERFEVDAPLLRTAREVNDSMPAFTVRTLARELAARGGVLDGATVLVLGLTYRPGVRETRATPARPVASALAERGAEVLAVDPMLDSAEGFDATLVSIEEAYEADLDAVVAVTPHEEFDDIEWGRWEGPLVVIDGRDSLDLAGTDHHVYTLGRGRNLE